MQSTRASSSLEALQRSLTEIKFGMLSDFDDQRGGGRGGGGRGDDRSGIALVKFNRPHRGNAFTLRMSVELKSVFEHVATDDRIRVVIVTGEGKMFCAGMDLIDVSRSEQNQQKASADENYDSTRDSGGVVALSIYHCRKPVIAAINGHCVGIGATMTLPMSIRIASEDAKIGFVFVRRGLVPEACSSWFLPRIVGITKASEWVLTGRLFKAKEEANSGLFNYVVPRDQVFPKAVEIAREIASHSTSPTSVSLSTTQLWAGLSLRDPHEAHLVETKLLHWLFTQHDFAEGVQSFVQKRDPQFASVVSPDGRKILVDTLQQVNKSKL